MKSARCDCGTCQRCKNRAKAQRYRDAHPGRVQELARAAYARNREHYVLKAKRWRDANPELARKMARDWQARNPDRAKQISKEWRANHPDRVRELNGRRRALKANAPLVEDVDRLRIYERDGGRCHICGKRAPIATFQLDHLIPLSKGGEHSARNLAVAHPSCNYKRHDGVLPAQLLLVGS